MGALRARAALCVALMVSTVGVAHAGQDAGPTQGELIASTREGMRPLPLVGTEVMGHIIGSVAKVKVKQTFNNPSEKPLEAIYVFPLPESAAVHDMTIVVRDKKIRGLIKRRDEARRIYSKAKKAGKTAALLDQERPNIFTQSVANIFPKSKVVVEIEFDVQLKYEDGYYSFVFPMVVGPRYIPGDPNGKPAVGWGESPDTDQVPDASKITPPLAPPHRRSGRTINLSVTLDPGMATREIYSPTHTISAAAEPSAGEHAVRVALASADEIPNKDFVLRYRLADSRPAMSVRSHMDQRGGFFALQFEPPHKPSAKDVMPKEIFFVVDTSGSMRGTPMELVRTAMRYAIANLNPEDTFQVIKFSSSASSLSEKPLSNTSENRARAMRYIDGLEGGGGTEMIRGIRAALDESHSSTTRLRVICFMTDGFIGNEKAILAEIEKKLGNNTRLFSFGVGSSPNRYLLERMAEVGRGSVQYMLPNEPAPEQVATFYSRIRAPVLTDVEIDWKGLKVSELSPRRVPDLFVGKPLALVGRFGKAGKATIEVKGRLGRRRVIYEVPVTLGESGSDSVARFWARSKIRDLELASLRGENNVEAITQLGLDFRLMTQYTSFVAVAEDAVVDPGDLKTVNVPTDLPEGMKRPDGGLTGDRGDDDDDDDDDSEAGDGDGDDDDDGDYDEEPDLDVSPAPTVAVREEATKAADRSFTGVSLAGSAVYSQSAYRSWRLGVGLGFGATSGALADESAFASSTALTLDFALTSRFAVGTGLNLVVRGPAEDRYIGNLMIQVTYLDLLERMLDRLRLELALGLGPSLSNDSGGLSAMGALKLRLPIPVGLQVRYDQAIRFDRKDVGTFTTGIEFTF